MAHSYSYIFSHHVAGDIFLVVPLHPRALNSGSVGNAASMKMKIAIAKYLFSRRAIVEKLRVPPAALDHVFTSPLDYPYSSTFPHHVAGDILLAAPLRPRALDFARLGNLPMKMKIANARLLHSRQELAAMLRVPPADLVHVINFPPYQ